jgi:uncharacterized RDD family membrane protein YckC
MTPETRPNPGLDYEMASEVKRLINFVIDMAILFGILQLLDTIPSPGTSPSDAMIVLIISTVFFLYYFLFETFLQRTPAKYITRTKVITRDGNKPGIGTIARRTLCRLVPFDPISAIGTPSDERSFWHDRWTQTLVVKA